MPIDSYHHRQPRYLGLRVVRVFAYVFGAVFAALGMLGLVMGLSGSVAALQQPPGPFRANQEWAAGFLLGLTFWWVVILWGVSLIWFALAGLIGVLIHTEENTRATAQLLHSLRTQMKYGQGLERD